MAKRNQQAKTEKSTVAVRFVAILLMLVMLVGVVMAVLQFCTPVGQNLKPSEWFSKTEQNKPDDPNKPDDTDPDQPDKPNPPAAQGTGGGFGFGVYDPCGTAPRIRNGQVGRVDARQGKGLRSLVGRKRSERLRNAVGERGKPVVRNGNV